MSERTIMANKLLRISFSVPASVGVHFEISSDKWEGLSVENKELVMRHYIKQTNTELLLNEADVSIEDCEPLDVEDIDIDSYEGWKRARGRRVMQIGFDLQKATHDQPRSSLGHDDRGDRQTQVQAGEGGDHLAPEPRSGPIRMTTCSVSAWMTNPCMTTLAPVPSSTPTSASIARYWGPRYSVSLAPSGCRKTSTCTLPMRCCTGQ